MVLEVVGRGDVICLVSSCGCFVVAAQFLYMLHHIKCDEDRAMNGCTKSAKRILLPCYKHLFRFMLCLYSFFGLLLLISLNRQTRDTITRRSRFEMIHYFLYLQLVIYTSVPAMFTRSYASIKVFFQTGKMLSPWVLVCSLVWLIQ